MSFVWVIKKVASWVFYSKDMVLLALCSCTVMGLFLWRYCTGTVLLVGQYFTVMVLELNIDHKAKEDQILTLLIQKTLCPFMSFDFFRTSNFTFVHAESVSGTNCNSVRFTERDNLSLVYNYCFRSCLGRSNRSKLFEIWQKILISLLGRVMCPQKNT